MRHWWYRLQVSIDVTDLFFSQVHKLRHGFMQLTAIVSLSVYYGIFKVIQCITAYTCFFIWRQVTWPYYLLIFIF